MKLIFLKNKKRKQFIKASKYLISLIRIICERYYCNFTANTIINLIYKLTHGKVFFIKKVEKF